MKEIKVDQFTSVFARSPTILTSGGAGPCIVVGALYGKHLDYGAMIHNSNFIINSNPLEAFLQKLTRPKKNNLRLYLAGGNPECDELPPSTTFYLNSSFQRKYVLDRIEHYSLTDRIRKFWWNDNPRKGVELTLYLQDRRARLSRFRKY